MGRGTLNGRWVRLMRDGDQDGGTGGGGGTGNQGQGGSGQGGSGQGGGAGGGGSGDDLFDDLDDGSGGGSGGGNGSGGNQNQNQPFTEAQMTALTQLFERGMDRRINAVLKDRRSKPRQQQNQQHQDDGDQGGQRQRQPVAADLEPVRREARLAFREYVGDRVKFVSDVERQHAQRLGQNLITGWDGDGDADQFGAQVAEQVATSVTELRKHYRDLTISQLRKRGLLKEDGKGNGAGNGAGQLGAEGGFQLPRLPNVPAAVTPPGIGSAPAMPLPPVSRAAAAVQTAVNMAAEYNERNGHVPANQQGS